MSALNPGIRLQWTNTRRKRAPAITTRTWNSHREEISRLHSSMKLEELMSHMKTEHGFTPSKHQFVLQLQKWDFRKYKSKDGSRSGTASSPASSTTTAPAVKVPLNVDEPLVIQLFDLPYDDDFEDMTEWAPDFDISVTQQHPTQHQPDLGLNAVPPHQDGSTCVDAVPSIDEELDEALRVLLEGNDSGDYSPTTMGMAPPVEQLNDLAVGSEGKRIPLSPTRSLKLQRVPRAQKRPRSINSLESTLEIPKRNRLDHTGDEIDIPFLENGLPSPNTLSTPSSPATTPASGVVSPPVNDQRVLQHSASITSHDTSVSSNNDFATTTNKTQLVNDLTDAILSSDGPHTRLKSSESPLVKLFRLAREGQILNSSDLSLRTKVQKLAWFFFGAGLYDEAFLLHLLVFKTFRTDPEIEESILFPLVIDLARCSRNQAQSHIVQDLLLRISRGRHTGKWSDPMENFLLHSFLTLVYRRQDNTSKADHHCHRAIQFFQTAQHCKKAASTRWLSLSIVAWTLLRSNVTEKRLLAKGARITNSVRRKVCSRASDQLIVNMRSNGGDETIEIPDEVVGQPQLHSKGVALRTLFEWCLSVLETSPKEIGSSRSWRKFRAKGMKLRYLGTTTLYCELWKAWHQEAGESSLTYTVSDYWSSTIENQLGINPSECLATIPETITIKWPIMDEDIPMLANWRTYHSELYQRAAVNLRELLELSDTNLAHHFFKAYSSHCIAFSKSSSEEIVRLNRELVVSFVDEKIDLILPSLTLQEHVKESSSRYSMAAEQAVEHAPDKRTSQPLEEPVRPPLSTPDMNPPTVDPSMTRPAYRYSTRSSDSTISTDLASMKSIQRRAAQRRVSRQVSDAESRLPSKAMRDCDAMSLDGLIGLTRRSVASLSLHEDDGDRHTDSFTRLLNDSSSQMDVLVH